MHKRESIDGTWLCTKCQVSLPLELFRLCKNGNPTSWCKKCTSGFYQNNPEAREKQLQKWRDDAKRRRDKDPEKYNQLQRERRQKLKRKMIDHYGGACVCCKESELVFLCIDHINGGGTKHRKSFGSSDGGQSMLQWIIKNNYPEGFQILCWNCNSAKHILGQCPHQKETPA